MQREPVIAGRHSAPLGWRLVYTALAVVAVMWVLSLAFVIVWEQIDTGRPASAIVVLGAAQYDGKPSPVLRARVDHAIVLWKRGLAPRLFVTGGMAPGDTTTEAAVAKRYAVANGVPDSVILLENASRTTSESLRNVAGMLGDNRRDVILVSDPFHMLRLSILARRFGLDPRTSPTRTSPISANHSEFWRYTLQESWKAPVAFFFEFYERP
jgi:uncharacterized SAM-binding protein YcdF (DUF218 family)